ncbi:DMT family transporter [Nocardioides euryhalodurans]|uniref:Multidrug efflux SMR transporter n=1 Tax=Nocardioides euryhalodurans TaxID=2518370 RepID=A0A4P7GKJ7_9ACTN|nr:multidrug efflux SMR transporter [Nocardioides euryhalodurans]QBR92555.1 multidrug efflux SMR transporter [Nocardioides euryhalodurans]
MLVAWLLLLAAIVAEVFATASLPRTDQFRDPAWTAAVIGGYALSIWLLTLVIRTLPVSVAYAVWAGLGTAGIAVIGVLFLDERMDIVKAAALLMIIGGVVVLNLHGTH